MKDLTKKLVMFTTNDNASLIDTVVSVIIENNIKSLDELKALENSYFTDISSLKNKMDFLYDEMVKDIYKFDNMSSHQMSLYDVMRDEYVSTDSMVKKLSLIISLYELLNYQMKLPYSCYSMIVNGKL